MCACTDLVVKYHNRSAGAYCVCYSFSSKTIMGVNKGEIF